MSHDEPANGFSGIEMSRDEIEAYLAECGHGVLALAADGGAYGLPVSLGFDGDRLYLSLLVFGDESEKLEAIEQTDTAAVIAYEVTDQFDWQSVVVRGPLEPVDEDDVEAVEAAMADTAWLPNLHPPTDPITAVRRFSMPLAQATGRHGPHRQV